MNAIVAYGSSSSSSESENDSDEDHNRPTEPKQSEANATKSASKLPKPTLDTNALQTSVFTNPYVQAEMAKSAILEKHVKMVAGKDNTQMINGKKICWSHRKGRCRFGHNCKYAHDTDIQKTSEELEAEKQQLQTKGLVCEGVGTMTSTPPPTTLQNAAAPTSDEVWEPANTRSKLKRPGLSQSLVPGKKVLKMYHNQKNKELK